MSSVYHSYTVIKIKVFKSSKKTPVKVRQKKLFQAAKIFQSTATIFKCYCKSKPFFCLCAILVHVVLAS